MLKIYAAFCLLIVVMLSLANVQGYVITSLLTGEARADKTANHYHK